MHKKDLLRILVKKRVMEGNLVEKTAGRQELKELYHPPGAAAAARCHYLLFPHCYAIVSDM
jgi:hypothetical protein